MPLKAKFLKTTILAALVGLTAAVAVTPASARDFDRHGGYERDRGDRHSHGGWDRHDRGGWGHRHFHRHHGWY